MVERVTYELIPPKCRCGLNAVPNMADVTLDPDTPRWVLWWTCRLGPYGPGHSIEEATS